MSPRLFSIVLLFALALPGTANAAEPSIDELEATAAGNAVSIRFKLAGAFQNDEFEKGLRSGLPTGFTYHIELVLKRPRWFDKILARSTVEVISTWNSVTQDYLINYRRDRRLVRSETIADLALLEQRMTTIVEGNILSLGTRGTGRARVRVRADFMPGYLLYVVPWELSTSWAETKIRSTGTK